MGKQLPSTRLLVLMEAMRWKGRDDWRSLPDNIQEQHILEFKVWVRKNLDFLPQGKVREDFERYYFKNESDDTGTGFYIRLDQGRSALAAIYQKEQELLNELGASNRA